MLICEVFTKSNSSHKMGKDATRLIPMAPKLELK